MNITARIEATLAGLILIVVIGLFGKYYQFEEISVNQNIAPINSIAPIVSR